VGGWKWEVGGGKLHSNAESLMRFFFDGTRTLRLHSAQVFADLDRGRTDFFLRS